MATELMLRKNDLKTSGDYQLSEGLMFIPYDYNKEVVI